jgi:peptide-methionine (S)-S-oxide reductase
MHEAAPTPLPQRKSTHNLASLCLLALITIHAFLMTSTHAADQSADSTKSSAQRVTLGGGCFWCVEAVFERIDGIHAVVSGYAGGHSPNPTYEEVCRGTSGHAEVVQIQFDPEKISYDQILEIFWEAHDPTTPNRQGADVGSQYRSIILYHNDSQKQTAENSKRSAASRFKRPIVTEIVPLTTFHVAEDYHQDYFRKNPNAPYCVGVISPKLKKLEKLQSK